MEKSITNLGTLTYEVVGTGKQTLILIPSGVGNSKTFNVLSQKLKTKYKLILINLPGTNGSHYINPNINNIAEGITVLLNDLNIENPILIGKSYGGNIALSICNLVRVKGIILLTSGEYFSNLQKLVLKLIFLLPKRVRKVRHIIGKFITKLGIVDFSKNSKDDFDNITDRWWEILSYKLPDIKISQRALIFFATKDKIINKVSIKKINDIFNKKTISFINSGHLDILGHFSNKGYELIDEYLMKVQ